MKVETISNRPSAQAKNNKKIKCGVEGTNSQNKFLAIKVGNSNLKSINIRVWIVIEGLSLQRMYIMMDVVTSKM